MEAKAAAARQDAKSGKTYAAQARCKTPICIKEFLKAKGPQNWLHWSGGVEKRPGVIKPRGYGRGCTTVGNLDTERSAQEVHNPRNGSKAVLLRGACSPAIGPNQGGQNEQDQSFHNPDNSGQGGVEQTGADKPVVEGEVEDAVPKGKGPPPDAISGVCAPTAEKVAAVKTAGSKAAATTASATTTAAAVQRSSK